jgi:hypothetical protein
LAAKVLLAEGSLPSSHDTRRWQSGRHLRTSLAALRRILDHLDRTNMRVPRAAWNLHRDCRFAPVCERLGRQVSRACSGRVAGVSAGVRQTLAMPESRRMVDVSAHRLGGPGEL